jgi:hypothetical protein
MAHRPFVRRILLMSALCAATAAITCRSHTYFDFTEADTVDLAQGDRPATITFNQLGDIDLGAHPTMRTQGLNVGDVSAARPVEAMVAITQPATGQSLAFLQKIDVLLTADGMNPVVVATGENFPATTNLVGLTVLPVEMVGYFKGKHPALTLVPTYADAVPANVTLTLRFALQVQVGQPGGSCQN